MEAHDTRTTTSVEAKEIELPNVNLVDILTSHTMLFLVVVFVGFFVRAAAIWGLDFPLGDGVIYHEIIQNVRAGNFAYPFTISYNGFDLPFMHAPLALYLIAYLTDFFNADLLDVLRWYPAIMSTLVVAMVYILNTAMFQSRWLMFTGALAFALFPSGFMIFSGDVTLVTGLFFGLMALRASYLLIAQRNENHLLWAGITLVLTFLSDVEVGYFCLYTIAVMLAVFGHNRFSILQMILLTMMVIGFVSVWALPIIIAHGISSPINAIEHLGILSAPLQQFITPGIAFTEEPFVPVLTVLGLIGFFVCIAKREWMLPLWLLAIWFFHHDGVKQLSLFPLAMLAAVAFCQLIFPLMLEACRKSYGEGFLWVHFYYSQRWILNINKNLYQIPIAIFMIALASYVMYSSISSLRYSEPTESLSKINQIIMQGIADPSTIPDEFLDNINMERLQSIGESSTFLVFTGANHWEGNSVLAWFPAITGHINITTVQGSALLGDELFHEKKNHYNRGNECLRSDVECLHQFENELLGIAPVEDETATDTAEQITSAEDIAFGYVYFSPSATGALVEYLTQSPDYERIINQDGVRVFERRILQQAESETQSGS